MTSSKRTTANLARALSPWRIVAVALCTAALVSGLPPLPAIVGFDDVALAAAGDTTRVSVTSTGAEANSHSSEPAVSKDGRFIVFKSSASNLVSGDTNNLPDVFLHDRVAGSTIRVSVSSAGAQADHASDYPDISDDGRFIAFESIASNLVSGDINGAANIYAGKDIFVYDRSTARTTRVSVGPLGAESNNESYQPYISGDGRFVTFGSRATNLVAGDTNAEQDVFLHDRKTGTTSLASVTVGGGFSQDQSISGGSYPDEISEDGQYVLFYSSASDFPCGQNGVENIYVWDRVAKTTTVGSPCWGGNSSFDGSITHNGQFIAFESRAANLVPGDTNDDDRGAGLSGRDVFVVDRATGGITRVSVSSSGAQTNEASNSGDPTISQFGRYVSFDSSADNLVAGDLNASGDIFMHDRQTAATTRVSVSSSGVEGDWYSAFDGVAMSRDGRITAFASRASNLVGGDTNAAIDIFAHDYGLTDDQVVTVPAIPFDQTFGPSGGIHGVNCSACLGDPVNTATGAFTTAVTDVALPGIGLPFEFTRSYTSQDDSVGPLGRGWTHSYFASLKVKENGDVVLRGEDGQRITYVLQPDGSFKYAVGGRSNLTPITGGYKLARPDGVIYEFNSGGQLLSVRDRNNRGVSLTHGASGTLDTITDSANRQISFTYDPAGLLTGIALPDARTVGYAYTAGLLTTVTDMRGGTTTYSYDTNNRLTKIVDQRAKTVVQNTYGADGRVTQQLEADGGTTLFAWDATTQTATVTDARGNAWKDVYSNNVLLRRIDPLGNVMNYEHDANLNVSKTIDARGNVTKMTYDARGNMLTRRAPAGLWYEETWTYDSANNVTSHKDDRGNTTTYEYDTAGSLIRQTEPGSVVTQYGRDPAGTGLLTSVTDPRGKVSRFEYDNQGNQTATITPLGHKTTMGYDSTGRMTSKVEPRGNVAGAIPAEFTWTYTYDAANNLKTTTDPLGNQTIDEYDAASNRIKATDERGNVTDFGYDDANRLVSVKGPGDATATQYSYDLNDNLMSRTDSKGRVTSYEYDPADRLIKVTSPLMKVWQYEYDPDGNIKMLTGPDGDATSYVNDELGRVAMVSYSGSLTPAVEFVYDGNGNRTAMIDGAGTQTYGYDALNRLTQVARGTDTFAYEYDLAGNVTKRTYPGGAIITYSYDDDGRPVSVTTGTSTTSYEYNAAGALTKTTLPSSNGHVETRTYDRAARLTDVTNAKGSTTLSRAALTLDAAGNPTQIVTTQGTRTFKYGPKNELSEACFAASCTLPTDPFIRYAYDSVGNRLSETRAMGTTTFDYNAGDQLLSKGGLSGTVSYSYDADGNQTAIGSRTFAYDVANRLKSTTLGSTTMTYTYDGDGKRMQASSGTQSAKKTNYLWDPNWGLPQLALERDGSNGLLRRYVHGNDLISMTAGTADFYYHHDAIGSVTNLTSSTGVAQWTYDYEPFGALRAETKHLTKAPTNLMKFAGELLDADTALYHLRARQYDPVQGRFGATDPLSKALTDPYVAAYVYSANRPTVLVDPSGLCELRDWTSPWDCVVDAVVNQNTSDFFAGWGDAASFGGTSWVRDRLGVNDVVNECSRYYMAGSLVGTANSVAVSGGLGAARSAGLARTWNTSRVGRGISVGAGRRFMVHAPHRIGAAGHSGKWHAQINRGGTAIWRYPQ